MDEHVIDMFSFMNYVTTPELYNNHCHCEMNTSKQCYVTNILISSILIPRDIRFGCRNNNIRLSTNYVPFKPLHFEILTAEFQENNLWESPVPRPHIMNKNCLAHSACCRGTKKKKKVHTLDQY